MQTQKRVDAARDQFSLLEQNTMLNKEEKHALLDSKTGGETVKLAPKFHLGEKQNEQEK